MADPDHDNFESREGKNEQFVWPPRRPPAPVTPTVDAAASSVIRLRQTPSEVMPTPIAPDRPWRQAIASIEHEWLDMTASPLRERMEEEHWTPDAPTDYCSRCALSVGRHEAVDGLCAICQAGETARPPWQRIIRLGEYEAPLNRWICEVKFTRWRKLGWDLGRVLGTSVRAQMDAARNTGWITNAPPTIVPVPMSWQRRWSRGIDHTLSIALGVAAETGGRVCQPLARAHRPSQTHVLPSQRDANVAGIFRPRRWGRGRMGGGLVIVVDDVTTTTSTLRGACRAVQTCLRLEQGNSSGNRKVSDWVVWGAVLARTAADTHDRVDEPLE